MSRCVLLIVLGMAATVLMFELRRKRLQQLVVLLQEEKARRDVAEEELSDAYHHLRDLGHHLLVLQEEERSRIGARIHDELGQALTAIGLDIAWIESHEQMSSEGVRDRFASMKNVLRTTLETVRLLAAELRPRILDESGLAVAMDWQVKTQCQRAGLESSFASEVPDVESILPELALSLFRDLQELLTNVVRHADAQMVVVTLAMKGGDLSLTVADDGRGFDPGTVAPRRSFGFRQVQDRARYWGGTVEVGSQPGGGAVVEVRAPIQRL